MLFLAAILIVQAAAGSPEPSRVDTYALPNGVEMTAVVTGKAKQGGKVWSCKGPIISCLNNQGSLGPGQQLPHSNVSPESVSFDDPAGTDKGSGSFIGIKLQYREGETVRISLTASKMRVSFAAYDCANGEVSFNQGVANPPQAARSVEFKFQPVSGRDQVRFGISASTIAQAYTRWSWRVSWTFEPGEHAGSNIAFSAADAQKVGAAYLMRGSPLEKLTNIEDYVRSAPQPSGIAADGLSLVLLRAKLESAGPATFSLAGAGGGLFPLEGEVPLKSAGKLSLSTQTRQDKAGNHWALALYRPPSYFGKGTGPKPILFKVSDGGGSASFSIDLVRPPVVLVHGTYDKPSVCYVDRESQDDAPMNLGPQLEALGYDVYCVDWESTNGMTDPSDFQTNKETVRNNPNGIRDALEATRRKGILVSQVDMVCHSQGGAIARTYCRGYPFTISLPPTHKHYRDPDRCKAGSVDCWFHRVDNYYVGDIHRLITVSTTHRGSAMCNVFKGLEAYPDRTMAEQIEKLFIEGFRTFVDVGVAGIKTGGFLNQEPDSLELQLIGPTPVPSHAIACVASNEVMRDARPDKVATFFKGSIPGMGAYWNNILKIWLGTSDEAREFLMSKLTDLAKRRGSPPEEADQRLAEYRRLNGLIATNRSLWGPLAAASPDTILRAFQSISPVDRENLNQLFFIIRAIVFEGDENDCTVAMKSSYGGLTAPFIFKAEGVLHSWAPRYRHVQRRVVEVLTDDGSLLDPDGFPGYTGIKSSASSFMTPIEVKSLALTDPQPSTGNSGNSGGAGAQGANKPAPKPGLKREKVTLDTAGVNTKIWVIDESGAATMSAPWGTAKYRIIAPEFIPKGETAELILEMEATPKPGQRMSVGMTIMGDEILRDPPGRELSVYVESGTTPVTKQERMVWKLSLRPDPQPGYRFVIGMTDGPRFVYTYAPGSQSPATQSPSGPVGEPPTKPTDPGKNEPPTGAADWTGSWDTAASLSREPLVLKQSGNDVTGTYGNGNGRLQGKVEGRKLKFSLLSANGAEGARGEVTLSADGKSFVGTFYELDDPDKTPLSLSATKIPRAPQRTDFPFVSIW